jgi:DNA-binding MarR family transcriptional regulator
MDDPGGDLSDANDERAARVFGDLVVETFRLNGRLLVVGDRLVEEINLTSSRWQVLGALNNAGEAMTVAQIARHMGLQRQSVQRTVDALRAEGLVKLVDNPSHRRARLVLLTPKGNQAVRKADRLRVRWANRKLRQRLGDRTPSR